MRNRIILSVALAVVIAALAWTLVDRKSTTFTSSINGARAPTLNNSITGAPAGTLNNSGNGTTNRDAQ